MQPNNYFEMSSHILYVSRESWQCMSFDKVPVFKHISTYNSRSSGRKVLNNTLPHSITEWKGSTICLHDQLGMGISEHASIRAFQPFFLAVSLPYSVIRREKIKVILTIYSYLQECLEVGFCIPYCLHL